MEKYNWTEITREDVIVAINKFLEYNPEYPEPRSTFLCYEGKKLPAKHIRGMSYQVHYGKDIKKSDFGGGLETVKFFLRLGFDVAYFGKSHEEKDKNINLPKKHSDNKNDKSVETKKLNYEKITISSKKVIEQKNALQLLLNKMFDGDMVCEKTFPWLKTPVDPFSKYEKLCSSLSSYRGDIAFAKENITLRCDFVCESHKLIIEYDERQHFSKARQIALESYTEIPANFDRSLWIKACEDVDAKDNSPKNRDEIRAYYDSIRDILAYENGYKLVRIMHGQIDFEALDAQKKLKKLLEVECTRRTLENESGNMLEKFPNDGKKTPIKVAMYLQTEEFKNKKAFDDILPTLKKMEADIVVFPEFCYVPFVENCNDFDILLAGDKNLIFDWCLELSKEIGKAVVVCSNDKYNTIYSVFANYNFNEGETELKLYIKHTMCGSSCLEFESYHEWAEDLFQPILYKGYLIGTTICYDCNHALFSRMYGMYGIDLIINSTGGNVVYDKWFKYNKVRAIENNCAALVTMGGSSDDDNNYVFGFNKNGGQLTPEYINGNSKKTNVPGGIYIYTIDDKCSHTESDESNRIETENKNQSMQIIVGHSTKWLKDALEVDDNVYITKYKDSNIIFLVVNREDILKPEIVQKLLYSEKIKKYTNKKYIIINRFDQVDEEFYKDKLSIVLKVRAMENFCAVILESNNINKCYQCGKNRTAQVIKEVDGVWGIDLERTTGPEAIWRDKQGIRASWRNNYEWLVSNCDNLYTE